MSAAKVTRIAREATQSDLFRSRRPKGSTKIVVTQDYAVFGALTPGDTYARRVERANVACGALRQAGYRVERNGAELWVTES